MVSFNDFPVTLADYTPGLSDLRTSIDGHPTGFYGTISSAENTIFRPEKREK